MSFSGQISAKPHFRVTSIKRLRKQVSLMTHTAEQFINLKDYPIDQDNAERSSLLASVRRDLQNDGCAVLKISSQSKGLRHLSAKQTVFHSRLINPLTARMCISRKMIQPCRETIHADSFLIAPIALYLLITLSPMARCDRYIILLGLKPS